MDAAPGELYRDNRFRGLINPQVELAPRTSAAHPMCPHLPFAGTVDPQPSSITHGMPRATLRQSKHGNLKHPLATTHGTVVGNGQCELHYLPHRREEALRGPQTEGIDRFEDQGAFNREIRIAAWCTRPRGGCCVPPACDRLFVEPDGETAPVDQRTVVCAPVANPITNDRRWFGHALS